MGKSNAVIQKSCRSRVGEVLSSNASAKISLVGALPLRSVCVPFQLSKDKPRWCVTFAFCVRSLSAQQR